MEVGGRVRDRRQETGGGRLELMPMRLNSGKSAKVGERQRDLARKFNKAGLLSDKGLKAVEAAGK
jgi:hypothetical protein